jgi:hypothetical protein
MTVLDCINDNCKGQIYIDHLYENKQVECPVCCQKYDYEYNEDSEYDSWPLLIRVGELDGIN